MSKRRRNIKGNEGKLMKKKMRDSIAELSAGLAQGSRSLSHSCAANQHQRRVIRPRHHLRTRTIKTH
jgi:hypothetical protein